MEFKTCPNCLIKINGIFSNKYIVDENIKHTLNQYLKTDTAGFCNGCAEDLTQRAKSFLTERIKSLIHIVPIITINNPLQWDYSVISIVSSQSVSGTGLFSEFSSSWSDFLGSQSNSLGQKLNDGENICRDKLRYKAALLGANAILGTDIDYAEVGGGKNMLMVCMAGTAVIVKNIADVIMEDVSNFDLLDESIKGLAIINTIKL